MRIKLIYKGDRPREKFIKFGVSRLKDSELLAIILGSGVRQKNILEISESVLKKIPRNFQENLIYKELIKIKGIGNINAMKVISIFEFAKRLKNNNEIIIYSPREIINELKSIRDIKKEYFYVFCLNSRNRVIKKELVSIGTLNSSLVHPREVFEPAIRNLSAQLVISHNHPSGDISPSSEDLEITNKLVKAGILLGISVIDHVIVSNNKYFSFKEKGLL